ncbi:DUF5776 domain-containing protein [Lactobacillaceae bacterium Scapto_B20]
MRTGQVKKYHQQPRNRVFEFKVKHIAISEDGLVRYYVQNHFTKSDVKLSKFIVKKIRHDEGYITADPDFIADAYYQSQDFDNAKHKTVQVINANGVRLHGDKQFKLNGTYYRLGTKIHVNKIVQYKGLTRFYVGHGKYLTSNKKFVRFL